MPTASPAAAPWVVPVVVVLVVAAAVLIAAALRAVARPVVHTWGTYPDDDLPRFAEAPPGSAAPPPAPGVTTRPGRGARSGILAVAAVLAVAGVLALAAAVVLTVAAGRTGRSQAASSAPETAQLRFGGVVLEQRAVGVTVTYPQVSVRTDSRGTAAHLRLPTFNCLADTPPADPLAAGCVRSLEEFADLTTPQLSVVRQGNGALRLTGRFATYVEPIGSPPRYTGRVYALSATARPGGNPAGGEFRLGG